MRRLITVLFLGGGLLTLVSCGRSGSLKAGQRFEVLEELRVNAATEWEQPYSDGFTAIIPMGAVLEVRFTTSPTASYFECTPVKVDNITNQVAIIEYFVPEAIRNRKGFKGFSISLPVKDIGARLRPVD